MIGTLPESSPDAPNSSTIDKYERAQEVRKVVASPPDAPEATVLRTQPWKETPNDHLDAISGTIFREIAEMDKRRQHLHSLQAHIESLRAVLLLKEGNEGCTEDVEGVYEDVTCAPFTSEPRDVTPEVKETLIATHPNPWDETHADTETAFSPSNPPKKNTGPRNGWKSVLHSLWH